jgi:hypothetical protein
MGKVSLFLILIGLLFFVPALVLTITAVILQTFILNQPSWCSIFLIFAIALFYVIACAFTVLSLIISNRDKE